MASFFKNTYQFFKFCLSITYLPSQCSSNRMRTWIYVILESFFSDIIYKRMAYLLLYFFIVIILCDNEKLHWWDLRSFIIMYDYICKKKFPKDLVSYFHIFTWKNIIKIGSRGYYFVKLLSTRIFTCPANRCLEKVWGKPSYITQFKY